MSYDWLAPLMFAGALVLIFTGYPVAFALGGTALVFASVGVAVGYLDWNLLLAMPDRTFGVMSNFVLLAVPFFIFMGTMLEKSRLAEDLLKTIGLLFGPLRGGLALAVGVAGLGLLAYQVSPPTWGFAGPLLSLLVGALALGLVSESMILGHWYLVKPKLPGQPLQELTFLLLAILTLQAALLVLNATVPARDPPESMALLAGSLASNPAFWLRVGVGLLFPLALAYMAWQSSREHAMMSATGLLYIAVGTVFTGELLARGILFVTAAPV